MLVRSRRVETLRQVLNLRGSQSCISQSYITLYVTIGMYYFMCYCITVHMHEFFNDIGAIEMLQLLTYFNYLNVTALLYVLLLLINRRQKKHAQNHLRCCSFKN